MVETKKAPRLNRGLGALGFKRLATTRNLPYGLPRASNSSNDRRSSLVVIVLNLRRFEYVLSTEGGKSVQMQLAKGHANQSAYRL